VFTLVYGIKHSYLYRRGGEFS